MQSLYLQLLYSQNLKIIILTPFDYCFLFGMLQFYYDVSVCVCIYSLISLFIYLILL